MRGGFADTSLEREAQEIMEGFIIYHIDVDFRSYKLLKKAGVLNSVSGFRERQKPVGRRVPVRLYVVLFFLRRTMFPSAWVS